MVNTILGSNLQYFKYPFFSFAETQKNNGITEVDLALISPHIYVDSEEIADPCAVISTLKEKGISIRTITPMPYRYSICSEKGSFQNEKTIGYYKQCILFAQRARAEYVFITASGAEYDKDKNVLLSCAEETLYTLSTFAEKHEVCLLLGTVLGEESPYNASTPVLTCLSEIKTVLSQVNSPALKAYLDTLAISLTGETITQWFSALGDNIRLIRFTDGNYNGYRIWGTGCLPCEKYLSELQSSKYSGPLSLAVPGERYCENPMEADNLMLAYFRTALSKV